METCLSFRSLQERRKGMEVFQASQSRRGKKRDDEVRKEDYDDEEGTEGKRRDEEEMQFSMLVDEGMMVHFLLDRLPLVSFPFKVFFSTKNKFNNHIIRMHSAKKFFTRTSLSITVFFALPINKNL